MGHDSLINVDDGNGGWKQRRSENVMRMFQNPQSGLIKNLKSVMSSISSCSYQILKSNETTNYFELERLTL